LADAHGWVVRLSEPFPGQEHLTLEERMATVLDPQRVVADLVAAADDTGCERVGLIGFCRGGLHAFQAAGSGRFDRAVSFYGMIRVPEAWRSGAAGEEPLEALGRPEACSTLAILGGCDPYTPPDDIEALRALDNVEVVVYPEAEHGFVHDPARPAHRPGDAADAWRRVAAFLA
jgi:carboxymethylenebutenolidase